MRFTVIVAIAAALAGCASDPQNTAAVGVAQAAAASAPAPAPQVCAKELPLGSTIPRTVCRPADGPGLDKSVVDDITRYRGAANKGGGN